MSTVSDVMLGLKDGRPHFALSWYMQTLAAGRFILIVTFYPVVFMMIWSLNPQWPVMNGHT